MGIRRLADTALCIAVILAVAAPASLRAQGGFTRAANRVVAVTADLALARAVTVDLTNGGPAPVPHGDLQLTVPTIDVVNGVVLRVHLAYYNPTDGAVTTPMPSDSDFVMVDPSGARFTLASVRSKVGRTAATFTVPALERVEFALVFLPNKSTATEAALKIRTDAGATLVLRGVPIRTNTPPPPP